MSVCKNKNIKDFKNVTISFEKRIKNKHEEYIYWNIQYP
ncbi:hypothetical protein SpAn4DRAFT_4107 [Sporomusa ovata]|uniref:Uncharacterized protein n=1 Tax=Sporomusa ovata TaxID=2378 RepID=A0A0U1L513_9FIRM|nr:hypothetical protein SpAn4DRAFT_4107 [Sporomusa ovata]